MSQLSMFGRVIDAFSPASRPSVTTPPSTGDNVAYLCRLTGMVITQREQDVPATAGGGPRCESLKAFADSLREDALSVFQRRSEWARSGRGLPAVQDWRNVA